MCVKLSCATADRPAGTQVTQPCYRLVYSSSSNTLSLIAHTARSSRIGTEGVVIFGVSNSKGATTLVARGALGL